MVDSKSILLKLKKNDLFKNCNISNFNFNDLKLNIIELREGEIVFRHGDQADSIYLVIDGEINLIKKQSFGKTNSLLSKHNFFGHEEYFLQINRSSIAIALKLSHIVELSKDDLHLILSQNSSILNNIRNSIMDLDSASINNFENIIENLPGGADKSLSIFPMELNAENKLNPTSNLTEEQLKTTEPDKPAITKTDLKKIESGITKVIKNINENLSELEEEKNKVRQAISDYEKDIRGQSDEITKLKDRENIFVKLDKEKNEILGHQSHRITELEKEILRLKDLESKYSEKIKFLSDKAANDKISLQNFESFLKEKDRIILKLDNELEENKKIISNFNEVRLKLLKENEDQDKLIREQKSNLKSYLEKIEKLSDELSDKDKNLSEIKKDLSNKNLLIAKQTESAIKINSEIETLRRSSDDKTEKIEGLSSKLNEMQNQLNTQHESEKNKNEFILNQSHKISRYEELLKSTQKELFEKEETITNFIKEIGELSENVWQKQNELNEQNTIITELDNEINHIKKTSADFLNQEAVQKEKLSSLKTQLDSTNNDLNDLKNTLQTKNTKINDLENVVSQLKNKLTDNSELLKLKDELNNVTVQLSLKNKTYDELEQEKNSLLEKMKNFKQITEQIKNDSNGVLLEMKDELNTLKYDVENYKNCIMEKDKIIEEQIKQFENLKETKSAIIKTLTSTKSEYQEEVKKRDDQIAGLVNKIEEMKKNLDEKIFLEEQQADTIENQAQKIAELEVSLTVNNDNEPIEKEEIIFTNSLAGTDSAENEPSMENETSSENEPVNEDDVILSKSKIIKSVSVNSFIDDNGLEYLQYSDIHIINLNLSRATMDVASLFNKFLSEIIDKNKNKLIVNLAACEFIDSSILGVLVTALKKARAVKGDLRIVWRSQSEYSMFSLTKMDNVFQIFKSLKNAVNSYL